MNKEDISNSLHPYLWEEWLETLGIDPEATEVCLAKSPHDHNKTVNDKE